MPKYFELLTDIDLASVRENAPARRQGPIGEDAGGSIPWRSGRRSSGQEFDRVFSKKEAPDTVPEHKASHSPIGMVDLLAESGLARVKKKRAVCWSKGLWKSMETHG